MGTGSVSRTLQSGSSPSVTRTLLVRALPGDIADFAGEMAVNAVLRCVLRKLAHHAVPLHAESSLQRAHVVGEASVDDTGISGACLISDVRVLFKDADLQTVSRKFTGDCTADNSAADDQNVIFMFHEIPP